MGASAFGATVTFSPSFGPTGINVGAGAGDFVAVPQFNAGTGGIPSGSTLNSVKLVLRADLTAVGSLHNESLVSSNLATVSFSGPFTLTAPGGNLVATPTLTTGQLGFAPNQTRLFGPIGSSASGTNALGNSQNAAFTGAGFVNMPLATAVGSSQVGTAALEILYPLAGDGVFVTAYVDVTYDYSDGSIVPEPKVYGMIGAALSLGVLGYRQYRSKKA